MTRLIAFLRAINVGGHTVKMDRLRALFEEIGCSRVETFIASGNVIFDAPSGHMSVLEEKIEKHLHEALGYKVATFLRTSAELVAVANYQPFLDEDSSQEGTVYVAFLLSAPDEAAQEKLMTFRTPVDDFHAQGREVYWLCRTRMSESAFSGAALEKALGQPATLRNISTVSKLAAKYG